MSELDIYSYYNDLGYRKYADSNDVVFSGAWSSSGSYTALGMEVVDYGQGQYICITDNGGKNPTTPPTRYYPTRYWSPFVLIMAGTGSGGGGGGPSIDDIYEIAVDGSNTANDALEIAIDGSNLANDAMEIAISGSNLAQDAMEVAISGSNLANDAMEVAISGSNLAQDAYGTASEALEIAIDGSNLANDAYEIAVSGSNTANDALEIAVDAYWKSVTGTTAYTIAVAGTNAAAAAQATADTALAVATLAYQSIVAGTDAAAAYALAGYALVTARAGTATANAAYTLATTGTHRACSIVLCSAYTPAAIGPDAAEIPVPYTWNSGSTTWNVNRLFLRVQTAGSVVAAGFEKSIGNGGFTAVSMGTVTLASNAYEGTLAPISTTVDSGNKLRFYALNLGTATNWTAVVDLGI